MIHTARTSLCVNGDTLASVEVGVHGAAEGGPLGFVRFGNLTLQSHGDVTPHDLADGLRKIAYQLDVAYDEWPRREKRAVG